MSGYIRKAVIASVLLLTTMLTGCGRRDDSGNEIPESTGGKDLVRAEAADNVFSLNTNPNYSKNPFVATNHSNQLVCDLLYENMVEVDENFRAVPNVISSWTCNDDATIWTLNLDTENAHVFSDGDPVTGRDLVYSIGFAIYNDRFRGRFSSFKGASYTDNGMQVTLGIGDSQFVKLLNIPVIKLGTFEVEAGVPPIGSGPYMYEDEELLSLVPNPNYPNAAQLPLKTIYLQEFTDAEGTLSAFEDGIIDIAVNDPSSYTSLGYASSNEIHSFATTNLHYIMFNEESTFGKSSAFRIAMQYAFDRSYLVELLGGNAVASPLPMYPTVDCYPAALAESLRYNLDVCKAVLQSAGIADTDGDGRMEYSGSSSGRFEIVMIVCADSSAKAGIANRFKDDMKSIGITVNVQELPWDEYLLALEEGSFESANREVVWDMYYGEVKLRNNFDLTELLQVRSKDNEKSNLNYSRSRDTSVLDRINNYLRATDAARSIAAQQLYEYITKSSGCLISIGFEKQQIITHRGVVKGMQPNFGNPLYGFANWSINMDD